MPKLHSGILLPDSPLGQYLKDDLTWGSPSGGGDVVGPASAVDSRFVGFDGTTGKLVKDSGSSASSFATASHNHDSSYAPLSHTHGAEDINSGTMATARLGSGTADSSTFLRGDQTWATPSGGSDPWTFVILGSDFTTTNSTNTSITGLSFTPSANTRYLVQGHLYLKTATTTVGARPGIAWPSGLTVQGSHVVAPNSATAFASQIRGSAATANAASTGLPNTTDPWLATVEASFLAGATPGGSFQITLASETAGTAVTATAGSWIAYRTFSAGSP